MTIGSKSVHSRSDRTRGTAARLNCSGSYEDRLETPAVAFSRSFIVVFKQATY